MRTVTLAIATGAILLAAACTDHASITATDANAPLLRRWRAGSLAVTPDSATLASGSTLQLDAVVYDRRGRLRTGVSPLWSSSDTSVATVSPTGQVAARGAGVTLVAATLDGVAGTAQITVPVAPATAAASVVVTPAPDTLLAGDSLRLVAVVRDSAGAIITPTIAWASSDSGVAAVTHDGMVKALAAGAVVVTAAVGTVVGIANLTIETPPAPTPPAVASVVVSPASLDLAVGGSAQLAATAYDSAGAVIAGRTGSWSSSAPSVASVSSDGRVTGLAPGTTTITATVDGRSASVPASVTSVVASAPADSTSCGRYPHLRLVSVATASELQPALDAAQPGDLIELQAGTYAGRFSITRPGSAQQPIVLCGTRQVVLDGGSPSGGNALHLADAPWWIVDGVEITNALRGVLVERSTHVTLRNLYVHDIGQEAVHLRAFSSFGLVERNQIQRTGLVAAPYGEGVYIGSHNGVWCTYSSCGPDATDSVLVIGNTFGPGITAENVDAKEGTTGGTIAGNTLSGVGTTAEDDWVDVKGNGWTIEGNNGSISPKNGYHAWSIVGGWGNDNVFRNNRADLQSSGYGFSIGSGTTGNAVRCDNVVTNAGAYSNVSCTP